MNHKEAELIYLLFALGVTVFYGMCLFFYPLHYDASTPNAMYFSLNFFFGLVAGIAFAITLYSKKVT